MNATNSGSLSESPSPSGEEHRFATVLGYDILDTPADGNFDRITALAARIFNVPIAIVSIVAEDRIWFKSRYGIDIEEVSRTPGLCASAILQYEPWVVTNAQVDPRTLANPLVAGELGLRFYAGMPLTASDGHNLGTICVIDKEPREVTPRELSILRDLAGMVVDQLELRLDARRTLAAQLKKSNDAEREADRVQHLVDTLQRSLLPPELPSIQGLELASAYLPSSSSEVGGDFYDVFPVSARSWGMVIGDVCGKGPDAAALTALARYTVRAATADAVSPAEVLSKVNQIMALRESSREGRFCTLAFARVRPTKVGAKVQIASGGHPIPLVLRVNGRVEPLGGRGCLVGTFVEATFSVQGRTLLPGDAILFYTDGVTEARSNEDQFGEDRLARTLASCAGSTSSEIVENIASTVASFAPEVRDDIALLVVRVQPTQPPG